MPGAFIHQLDMGRLPGVSDIETSLRRPGRKLKGKTPDPRRGLDPSVALGELKHCLF
jgi:hypothetical protein